MHDPEANPIADGSAQKATPRDPALLMRRAIRTVAAAELIVAESLASAARRGSDLNARQATSAHRARERSTADRPDADRPDAGEVDERHAECEAALDVAVDEYVCLLRAAGKASERALIHLKHVLRSAPAVDLEGRARRYLLRYYRENRATLCHRRHTLRSSNRRPPRPLLICPVASGCAHPRFRWTCRGNVVPFRSTSQIDAGRRGRFLVVARLLASDRGAGRLAPACSPSSPPYRQLAARSCA